MTDLERMMGDIIIAFVKAAGGYVKIPQSALEREPNETVYVEHTEDGLTLKIKDVTTIEGV